MFHVECKPPSVRLYGPLLALIIYVLLLIFDGCFLCRVSTLVPTLSFFGRSLFLPFLGLLNVYMLRLLLCPARAFRLHL